ncbi:MAG: serine/threonine-protein phosphatase [Chloroflexi bacterium]|jgi:PPM family protein phosphatase|nr:serine/threonine-protein phosphatase [Chloroflexota bacterium]MBT3670696.1 serine/threonine-protein phosphatase [Chloroflexota bacterium]MBT4002645.1 serine/threonine-protein phosphatase [Chloroflexota bacterium]MBT4306268.1 serine/threonine-protein phosphatase [Chloroflexota bacterium]MBT4532851.1 serine/threonine-protein phosphatase [Chloroflexota bacterium]
MSNFIKNIIDKLFPSSTGRKDQDSFDPGPYSSGGINLNSSKKGQTSTNFNAATAPLTEDQLADLQLKSNQIEPKQLIVGVGRDVGRQRQNNEDSIFSLSTIIDSNETSLPVGIFIVADGMGGHNNGEVASELAVRTMSYHLVKTLYPAIFSPKPHAPENSLQEILISGVTQANEMINKHSNGGGTTLTAALTIGSQMTIAHVGDSRAYSIFLDGRMEPLTRDHSLVSRLVELGQITEEEAKHHPQKSTLYNAVGQSTVPRPDIVNANFPQPGYLMICSDGLWGVLEEDDMFTIITNASSPQRACQDLVDAANAAGGPDNIAVILAKLSE